MGYFGEFRGATTFLKVSRAGGGGAKPFWHILPQKCASILCHDPTTCTMVGEKLSFV